ncbi:2336_t:CDS:1 [Scutellospora calospora]|uniref:2336_t:CDS:1 n=1 Tax=Scutellospora calospora TaxID=85575 RepID=A0ACA9MDR7_9GLOM|nr:2336_t:CDS:1 [Scutellospora calospora]
MPVSKKEKIHKVKTFTKKTSCLNCRKRGIKCEKEDSEENCSLCTRQGKKCIIFKPQYMEKHIVELTEEVRRNKEEIQDLKIRVTNLEKSHNKLLLNLKQRSILDEELKLEFNF